MDRNQPSSIFQLFLVLASTLGLVSIVMFVLTSPASTDSFVLRKPLVGSVFMLICILGALAVVVPGKCNSILQAREAGGSFGSHSASAGSHSLKGHHYDCQGYSSHIIKLDGRTLCAACSGLLLGAIAAIFASVAYFFLAMELSRFSLGLLAIGIVLVAFGFVQFLFRGISRLLINASFVLGAFLVLVSADALLMNVFIDFYIISLTLLWILTRILLSQWDHSRICRSCTAECEMKK